VIQPTRDQVTLILALVAFFGGKFVGYTTKEVSCEEAPKAEKPQDTVPAAAQAAWPNL